MMEGWGGGMGGGLISDPVRVILQSRCHPYIVQTIRRPFPTVM